MKKIKLTMAYDGSNYCGWQIQNNAVTVQQKIQEACHKLFSREIKCVGASRTDTGVHALGQVAVIEVDTTIPDDRIPYALNAYLPNDIVITHAQEVPEDFHPRYQAIDKTYVYKIYNGPFPVPQYTRYAYFYPKSLHVDKMQTGAQYLIGRHDFKAFCSAGSSVKSTVREIYQCDVATYNGCIHITIKGNGFLYNMVRIIVGTLLDIGLGKREPDSMQSIIASLNREQAGVTAPAKGLTLAAIQYA
ncbi:tRNA pseudouridine(38-40) synthase TruA [Vallitalea pronyensis]|uniref:tRNA pseudouridine synthase A n=1 Tax=Vallitalea pronyensis TaxID=1348613 RepID=A0A8J8MHG3_9FIRM|nr:tRNA pseudouridine(38-40) synthase TruA [Vallitalea pronyensis]QUI21511.1 tRNA pseudouridine(38-40) synthase TruA [Vallitalea pronyensis]